MQKQKLFFGLFIFCASFCEAQIPILNSYPAITNKVIYLDFDGQKVSGTLWNNGTTINAQPSGASSTMINQIWQRVSEDYRPFDVNITTDSNRFNSANPINRIRVVFTPTSAWYGTNAGGVAFLQSFSWGGYPGTPCWIFENLIGFSAKNMAEGAAHEVGHTLSLVHQSTYNTACLKTAEYNAGTGTGITGWAPIMGVGYNKNVTLFHNGKSANSCNQIQNDLSNSLQGGITGMPYLSFLPDDIGNTYANAKILNLTSTAHSDSGLINTTSDVDVFKFTICSSRYVSINAKPWALDTTAYNGANMDVKLKLYNSSGNLIAWDSTITKLSALVGATLPAGSYYFSIDGDASAYYSDYGVLGKYYIKIKTNNPPAITNTITLASGICAPQSVQLTYTTNTNSNIFLWTVNGTTFNAQNPNYNFSTPGIYTVSLLANTSTSASCLVTNTYNIGAPPNLTVANSSASFCPGSTGTISVSGASSYTWLPGNLSGSFQIVTANSNLNYTILGYNGSCASSTAASIGVNPNYTLNVSVSNNVVCAGKSLTITPSSVGVGSITYTLNPGGLTNPPFVVNPTVSTNYFITSYDGTCYKNSTKSVSVNPSFTIGVDKSDTVVCVNMPVTFFAYGANSFTTNPSNQVGYQVVVTPSATTVYTVTGTDANLCNTDSIFTMKTILCNLVGIEKNDNSKGILVYPNPANKQFVIQSDESKVTYEIYDALGRVMLTGNFESSLNQAIKISTWNKGMYLIKFNTSNNETLVRKVIVE